MRSRSIPFGRGWQSPFSNSRALKRNSRVTEGGESEKRGQRVDESVTKYFNKASEKGMMGERERGLKVLDTNREG